ncbi:ATP-dependent RNA helicase DDX49-like [Oopsacas minuta]|uniref:RNA helicase n=1 Tax=Oopsacas minuta TaxID=111878 RepID=A0AAV7JAV6_9METZ|nr:ATP-dependent RNA helicase DDX49-like [Oopsacas minuta]
MTSSNKISKRKSIIEGDTSKDTFSDLELDEWVVRACSYLGIHHPTPVQSNCIPAILRGRDCIGCAETGSGKTAAFALPILQTLAVDPYGIFALVLTPTRELAIQIADQFKAFGAHISIRVTVVVGGMDMIEQGIMLANKPHVVVGTPGRLADHLKSTDFSLKKVRYLVLDEADRLLAPSFQPDLETIFSSLPARRQTLIFSATLTDTLKQLSAITNDNCFSWTEPRQTATVSTLDQKYIFIPAKVRDVYLTHLVDLFHTIENKTVLVFTSTCKSCQVLTELLRKLDCPCVCMHSIMNQSERIASLAKFKSSLIKVLVSTDVGSRGLDIPRVGVVINYNVPASPKDYVHRVGRTARAGLYGRAVTLVSQFDVKRLLAIEKLISTKMEKFELQESVVLKKLQTVSIARREVEVRLKENEFGEKQRINKAKRKLLEDALREQDELESEIKRKK